MTDPARTPFVGGNWKMNTDSNAARALAEGVASGIESAMVEIAVFPPFPYLRLVREVAADYGRLILGAQDISDHDDGAFTGEVSATMLKDCAVTSVLTGHSERRHVIGESDALVGAKTAKALSAGLTAVLCVGETLEQREAGETDAVNARQLEAGLSGVDAGGIGGVVIAYEPVWAIGTGKTASPADAQDAHAKIRAWLTERYGDGVAGATRIIYGGSVKPANASELFSQADIDGGLIGGASLDASGFLQIVKAAG